MKIIFLISFLVLAACSTMNAEKLANTSSHALCKKAENPKMSNSRKEMIYKEVESRGHMCPAIAHTASENSGTVEPYQLPTNAPKRTTCNHAGDTTQCTTY